MRANPFWALGLFIASVPFALSACPAEPAPPPVVPAPEPPTHPDPVPAPGPVDPPDAGAPPAVSSSAAAPQPEPPVDPRAMHPANFHPPSTAITPIGTPCTPSAPQRGVDPCGSKGRIAIEENTYSAGPMNGPCTLTRMKGKSIAATPSACISGDRLWAMSACYVCRMPGAGWSMQGVLSEMTPAQLHEAQKQLNLPEKPVLIDAASWTKAIERAAEHLP